MPTEAEVLLSKLDDKNYFKGSFKVRISTEKALLSFSVYLEKLVKENLKNYTPNKLPNLIPSIYRSNYILSNEISLTNYYKDSLCIACACFKELVVRIYNGKAKITFQDIKPYQQLIRSYIFDLKPYVEFFESKRDKNYEMFSGGKIYTIYPFEFNKLSGNLFWGSSYKSEVLDQRFALNLSCFTIRQSLEIRFKNALGVSQLRDHKHNNIKLKHDFFPNFIKANKEHFNLPDIDLVSLMKIYNWTNRIIHSGTSPRVWEVQYALKSVEPLFMTKELNLEEGKRVISSIYGSIQIKDYLRLKEKLKNEISLLLEHDRFIIKFATPEAILLD